MRHIAACLMILTIALTGCKRDLPLTTTSPEAEHLYRQGVRQYERFFYSESKDFFEKAIGLDSSFAMAWTRLGIVYLAIRDEPEALVCLLNAMRQSDKVSERERLFIHMWYYRVTFDSKTSAAVADSLALRYPQEKEVYLFRGNLYEQAKNYEAAIRSYQKAIQTDTGYALAVMTLGYAYSSIGEQEKAVVQMQRYIRLAPDEPDPRASYADILLRAGRFDEALEQYQESLRLKPDYWYSLRQIGEIDAIKGKLKEAEKEYHVSMQYLPQNRQLESTEAQLRGGLEYLRGNYPAAVTLYRQALASDTLNLDAAFGLLGTYARTGRFAEAHDAIARVYDEFRIRELLNSPAMAALFVMRSFVLMHEGKLPEALHACDSALNYSSSLARAAVYRQMAEVYLREKSFEQGLGACEDGLTLTPNSPEILLTLTRLYAAKGDHRMAAEIGSRLLDLWNSADPDFEYRREVLQLTGHSPVH